MAITFSSDDIFEIAERIESNGVLFYHTAAERFADSPVRYKLMDLAEMEHEHQKTFAEIRSELTEGERTILTFDPDNQSAMYLQAAVDGKVFDLDAGVETLIPEGSTVEDVLETAIRLEKDSIVFYTGMKDMVRGDAGRNMIDVIINQEIGHIVDLTNQIDSLHRETFER